jgi:transketolase
MTHDSIGLGEDGPTHQPVEHLSALRTIPGLVVMRPCDAVETSECWELALTRKEGPTLLALSRQDLPPARIEPSVQNLSARGAYLLRAASKAPRAVLIATGSEVGIALAARDKLEADGIPASVVSMPSTSLFDRQSADYRASLFPERAVRVAVEAASSWGWERYIGIEGGFVGMPGFGASAPYKTLYEKFGITAEAVVKAVRERL